MNIRLLLQRAGRTGRALGASALGLLPETTLLAGAWLLYQGLGDIYPPLADIVLGALLLIAGCRLALGEARDRAAAKRRERTNA